MGTPVPGAWSCRVSSGTGWPSVSILWPGEIESWTCYFYFSVAAHPIVWADPSLIDTNMLIGCQSSQQTRTEETSVCCLGFDSLTAGWLVGSWCFTPCQGIHGPSTLILYQGIDTLTFHLDFMSGDRYTDLPSCQGVDTRTFHLDFMSGDRYTDLPSCQGIDTLTFHHVRG